MVYLRPTLELIFKSMDKNGLKEVIRKYQEKLKDFKPYLQRIDDSITEYEGAMKDAGEYMSSGMQNRIAEVRKALSKFDELNQKIAGLKDNL